MSPASTEVNFTGIFSVRRFQNSGNALKRSRCLRHDVTHETDNDDGENENRKVAVELREVTQSHGR
jgi:hypothetical protein